MERSARVFPSPELRFIASVILLVLLLSCLGCVKGGRNDAGKIRLRLSGYTSSPEETKFLSALAEEFKAANPQIDVSYEPIPGNYVPKILTMLVSGTSPDVFYLDGLYFHTFLSKNVLLPLDEYMKETGTRPSDFYPAMLSAFSSGGKIYGIPKDFNTLALFYNKAFFDEARIPYPDEKWDWRRLRETALRLTRTGQDPHYGICLPLDIPARWLPFAFQAGAELFSPDKKSSRVSEADWVDSLEFYSSFKLRDGSSASPQEMGAGWAGDALGKGLCAMALEGGWLIPYLESTFPEVRYGLTELPRGPKGRSNLIFTVAYVIPRSCSHPREAWKLIEHLTSFDVQCRVRFALPSRIAAGEQYVRKHPQYTPIFRSASYGRPYQFGARSDKVIDILGVAMQEVFLTPTKPQEALTRAEKELDALLKI